MALPGSTRAKVEKTKCIMIDGKLLEKFINQDSKQIDGWFFPGDILAFAAIDHCQSVMGIAGGIAEIGVWHGKSLVFLSHLLRVDAGESLYGIDIFPEQTLESTKANLDQYGSGCQVGLLRVDTTALGVEDVAKLFASPLRFLHIDAGHEYHEVMQQCLLFAPHLRRGGIIAFDDYQDREFPGIEAAVLDFCEIDRPRRFVPFFAGANKMYCCEVGVASAYQRELLKIGFISNQIRYVKVRDFWVLIGFSKLPVDPTAVLERLNALNEYGYEQNAVDELSRIAKLTNQLKMM